MKYFGYIFLLLMVMFAGCNIEETHSRSGGIFVQLRDSQGSAVTGARIWLDGVQTAQVTPAVLVQVPTGPHVVMTTKPGYEAATTEVFVLEDDTVAVELVAADVPLAHIEMTDAPSGTTILIDNSPFVTTPPNHFDIGIGSWLISAYLPGHATNVPSRLLRTLSPRDTLTILTQFTALEQGNQVGQLAPVFTLLSDGDGTTFYSLQDFRGKIVLVSFFFYTCAPCLAEFPHIQEVYADPAYAGWFTVLGVDRIDPWALFNQYRANHAYLGLQFPLLWDQQTHQTDPYEIESCPSNFLIDPSGVIRYKWGGVSEAQLRSAVESLMTEFGD